MGVEVPFAHPRNALELPLESLTLSERPGGVRGLCGGVGCRGEGLALGLAVPAQGGPQSCRGHRQGLAPHL